MKAMTINDFLISCISFVSPQYRGSLVSGLTDQRADYREIYHFGIFRKKDILRGMKSIYDAEYRRVTQKDLASKLGCPQPFISKVETFARRLDLIETIRICEALNITVDQLLHRDIDT